MESPLTQSERWRQRLQWFRQQLPKMAVFVLGSLALFLAILVYSYLRPAPAQLTAVEVNEMVVEVMASATPPRAYAASVFQVIRPSLVLIQVEGEDENMETAFGVGSGVVINADGDILTSLHVVAEATDIQITFFIDGSQSAAVIMTEQPENDIAVLRAVQPPEVIVPAILGNPNAMRVGDEAFVVGNPLGLSGSMSAGVISAFDRTFKPINSGQQLEGLIQFDAAVNPGNSGGPLLNRNGQIIGIVTGLVNPTEQEVFIGIGFAVPIDVAASGAGLPPY